MFIAGSTLFSLTFLLSTVFGDLWRLPLIALCLASLMSFVRQIVSEPSSYSLVGVVIAEPYFRVKKSAAEAGALPSPSRRVLRGLARASLVLGLIWGVWHLPLFFVPGLGNYGQSFPLFVLGSTALSVAIAGSMRTPMEACCSRC